MRPQKLIFLFSFVLFLSFTPKVFAYRLRFDGTQVPLSWDGTYFSTSDPLTDWGDNNSGVNTYYSSDPLHGAPGAPSGDARVSPEIFSASDLQSGHVVTFGKSFAFYSEVQNYDAGSFTACTASYPDGICYGALSDTKQFDASAFPDVVQHGSYMLFSVNSSGVITALSPITVSSEKAITAFGFQGLTPSVSGVIDETNHTITLTVPFGTDVTSIAPTITISSGASISPDNNTPQDFSNPVTYTVTASDGSTQTYIVTVVVAAPTRNPVIIIPGVTGTEINKGPEKLWLDLEHNLTDISDGFMDPLQFNPDLTPSDPSLTLGDVLRKATVNVGVGEATLYNYTFGLLGEFENQGYVEGTDVFLFPYDWRYGINEDNVTKLKQKITDILTQTGADKVDIIAHSMGGLLAKKYVMENPTDNHIDKAVFVGVPNTGAPKAIKNLLVGDGNLLTADSEMQKISKNMPAAYDLTPSEQYFNKKGSYVEVIDQEGLTYTHKDLNFDEVDNFLVGDHQLNAQALVNAHNLHTADFDNYDLRTAGVDLYAIDGCKAGTFGKVKEVRYHSLLGDFTSYMAPEEVIGDGTVPLESATNLPIDQGNKYYALKGNHGDMLSQDGTRQEIVNLISNSTLSTQDSSGHDILTQDISKCNLNGRAISVYSPLSIDIVDQDGNHTGLASDGVSIENNIPNADFEIIGEHKFVYLPTDDGQTYTIKVVGTDTGTFTITDATIDANNITQTQVFSDISVTPSLLGHINLSSTTTLTLDTNGDGITDQTLEPTSVLDAEQSQDFVPDQPNNNPPENNVGNSTSRGSSGGALSSGPVVSEPVVLAEAPLEIPGIKQKIISALVKSTPIIEDEKPTQVEPQPETNTLTANVVDSNTPVNYEIIVLVIAGIVIVLLVAKKFVKL